MTVTWPRYLVSPGCRLPSPVPRYALLSDECVRCGPFIRKVPKGVSPSLFPQLIVRAALSLTSKGIEVTFVIPASHVDLQNKIDEFGLRELSDRFARELGRVVDFDFPNEFTRDRENFGDPYHFHATQEMLEAILTDASHPPLAR